MRELVGDPREPANDKEVQPVQRRSLDTYPNLMWRADFRDRDLGNAEPVETPCPREGEGPHQEARTSSSHVVKAPSVS
jgi:hypothetical protein